MLEANLFRIFISLWYLPLVKIPKKCSRQEWHVLNNLTGNYTMKHFFPLNNRCYNYCKKNVLPIFIAEVVKKAYSFIKIMKPISPNYNWENGAKQVKITEENLQQSCILCQLLRTKTLALGQYFFNFYHYLPYIYWVDVSYLTCLVFLISLWWLVWIFHDPHKSPLLSSTTYLMYGPLTKWDFGINMSYVGKDKKLISGRGKLINKVACEWLSWKGETNNCDCISSE